jgi:hypothetical protein
MDRLHGQLQDALSRVQSDPAGASAELGRIAADFTAIAGRLDQAGAQNSLELLPQLSGIAADNAGIAGLGAQLADAAGAGDQSRAQQLATELGQKEAETGIGEGAVEKWWAARIKPLQREYTGLQERQEALDAEAVQSFQSL